MSEHSFKWGSAGGNTFDLKGGNAFWDIAPDAKPLDCDTGDPAIAFAGRRLFKIGVKGATVPQSELANIKTVTSTTVTVLQASYPALTIYENGAGVTYLVAPPKFNITAIPGTTDMAVDLETWVRASSGTGRTLVVDSVTIKYGIKPEQVAQENCTKLTPVSGRDDHRIKFVGEQPQKVTFIGWIADSDLDALQQDYATGTSVECTGDIFDTTTGGKITTNRATKAFLTSLRTLDYEGALIQVQVTLLEDTNP